VQYLGNEKLARLTKPAIPAFRDKLLLEGLTHRTTRHILTSLKGVLKESETRGLVAQNVALGVSVNTQTRHKRKLEVGVDLPNKDEVRRLITAAEGRWRPLIVTAVMTGMRASELRGLRWSNIDFAKKVVQVQQRANYWGELGMPKSEAGQRKIPMSPMVVNVLREWKLACPKGELGLVFPNTIGNVETHSNLVNRGWFPT
jgi:integrase